MGPSLFAEAVVDVDDDHEKDQHLEKAHAGLLSSLRTQQARQIRHRVPVLLGKALESPPEAIQRNIGAADQSSHSGFESPATVWLLFHRVSLMTR
jgi:hypothetical protein